MKIVGSYVSPYVRKVTACLHLKGLMYEIDPITPFFGNDESERLSMPEGMRHGTAFEVPAEVARRLLDAYGPRGTR